MTRIEKLASFMLLATALAGCSGGGGQSVTPDGGTVDTERRWRGTWNRTRAQATSAPATATTAAAGSSASDVQAQALTAAAVAPGGAGPAHILTYQDPLTTSSTSLGGNLSEAGKYVSYAITNNDTNPALRAAGIKTGFYFDAHNTCTSNFFGACLTSLLSVPDAAYARTCDGAKVTNTHAANVTQYQVDLSTAAARELLQNVVNYHSTQPWDFGFSDDAQDLTEISAFYQYKNANTGQNLDKPYCNYNPATYASGVEQFYASSKLPMIANTLMPSGTSAASAGSKYFSAAPPLIGAMMEAPFGSPWNGSARTKESGSIWQSELNSEIATANANRLFVGYEHVGGTDAAGIDARTYVYASLMLGFKLTSTVLASDGTPTSSRIGVNPEALLVPTNPIVSAPSDASSLQKNGGAYVREFTNCYYKGASIGACASVVNSNGSGTVSLPTLSRSYAHTAVISGAGVMPGIDNGSVNVAGPAAPSTIEAETAYILVQ